ncbi:tetratricopeptide repeat protein [Amycolatopsis sp. NPDC051071]|uniref:tetratricopeptide repeat protein n=1 Tax=Amycolatopsis sp. NPDC051071 TaxID=3154637 RepID=UPI00343163B1
MAELQQAFAADLDHLRQLAGMSVAELARRSGQASSSVGDLLRGGWVRAPSWDQVSSLVAACVTTLPSHAQTTEARRLGDLAWWRGQHADLVRRLSAAPPKRAKSSPTADTKTYPTQHSLRRPKAFMGRSNELRQLETALANSQQAARAVIHGLGGTGKSTLAARFAELHEDRFDLVWWVSADSEAALTTGLADLAVSLEPAAASAPLEQRVDMALRWLATHPSWLLVLDNLTAPSDADVVLSRVRTGTVVITSRRGTGWEGIPAIPINMLKPDEARQLLAWTVNADWPDADLDGAAQLCEELGWLPLAIHQAGAYIAQTRITPTAYLTLLTHYPARMFTATGESGDAQRTMARIWHVTLDKLADTPRAEELLRRLAWCAPTSIPRNLLTAATSADDHLDLIHATGRLAAYSMITLDPDTISVHRLVQAVTRTPDPADQHRQPDNIAQARDTTAAALVAPLIDTDPHMPASWSTFRLVLPHARALLGYAFSGLDTVSVCELASRIGSYQLDQGDTTTAVAYHTRAAQGFYRLLGADHPNTLNSRSNLASAYQDNGDLARAIPLFEAALADAERVFGPDAQETLDFLHNLAGAYRTDGDLDRAIPLFETVLTSREQVLGKSHPATFVCRSNLAAASEASGDLSRAISLNESLVADRTQTLGPHHPHTLISRNNLAGSYQAAGDLEHAIPLLQSVLADLEHVLGVDHPTTMTTRHNLAEVYHRSGNPDPAIPLLESTVAGYERALGADHPKSLACRLCLAAACRDAGDLDRAISLYEAALLSCEDALGSSDLQTLTCRNELATTYHINGQLNQAIPLREAVLANGERIFGENTQTMVFRNNLAAAYQAAGKNEQSIPLFESALTGFERILGSQHQTTELIRSNLKAARENVDRA